MTLYEKRKIRKIKNEIFFGGKRKFLKITENWLNESGNQRTK